MTGPYAVSDGKSEIDEWTCPRCGHVCQRFRWEYAPEVRQDPFAPREGRPAPYWKDEKRWKEIRAKARYTRRFAFPPMDGETPDGENE